MMNFPAIKYLILSRHTHSLIYFLNKYYASALCQVMRAAGEDVTRTLVLQADQSRSPTAQRVRAVTVLWTAEVCHHS